MPEVEHGYCTLDDLREQLGDGNEQLNKNMLARAINAASRSIDAYCNRRFWQDPTPTSMLFYPDPGSTDLWLDEDISTETGLIVSTDNAGNGLYDVPWATSDYRLWPYGANRGSSIYKAWYKLESTGVNRFDVRGLHRHNNRGGYLPVQVTARFGWASVPAPIEQATLLKATHVFKRKDAPFGILQFGDIAAASVTRKDADVLELLWPYQRDVGMVG